MWSRRYKNAVVAEFAQIFYINWLLHTKKSWAVENNHTEKNHKHHIYIFGYLQHQNINNTPHTGCMCNREYQIWPNPHLCNHLVLTNPPFPKQLIKFQNNYIIASAPIKYQPKPTLNLGQKLIFWYFSCSWQTILWVSFHDSTAPI
jgi:hypothetical protein